MRREWKLIIDSVFEANNFPTGKGTNDIDKDVMICANMYAEPAFRYEKGEEYWKNEIQDIKSMANNKKFNEKDIEITKEFLEFLRPQISGGIVLDICGGSSRCGEVLSDMYNTIDIFDIKPSFGELAHEKRGTLIQGNLKDFGMLVE